MVCLWTDNLFSKLPGKKAEYVARLENIFHSIDSTGEGVLTEARLTEILANAPLG